jgi:hypothetical protein
MSTTNNAEPGGLEVLELVPTGAKRLVVNPLNSAKLVFEEFKGSLYDHDRELTCSMTVFVDEDEARVLSLTVEAGEQNSIAHKRLALETYLRAFVNHLQFEGDPEGMAAAIVVGRGGSGRRDLDRLQQVARWYQEAKAAKEATGKYIARRAGTNPDYARRLVLEARKAGFIPPKKVKS